MKESSTYQAILAEGEAKGKAEEARTLLIRQGTKRFGPPTTQKIAELEAISDMARLEALTERLLDVNNWDERLSSP